MKLIPFVFECVGKRKKKCNISNEEPSMMILPVIMSLLLQML